MYPLYDGTNRILVSWAPCLLQRTGGGTQVCSSTNITTGAGRRPDLSPPQYTVWVYDFDAGTLMPLLSAEQGTEIVEPVVLQARTPVPTFIPDSTPANAAQQTLVNNGVGILDITSVYDFDGVDTAKPDIATQANPMQASFYTRPARFVRIEKAVEIPPKTVRKISQIGLRTRRHGHAGDPGLCAGAARRLGADPGAGAGAVHHRCAGCECPAHHHPAHELDAGAAR